LLVTALVLLGSACELEPGNVGDSDMDDILGSDGGANANGDANGNSPGDDQLVDASAGGGDGDTGADAGAETTDPDVDAAVDAPESDAGGDEQTADAGSEPSPSTDAGTEPEVDASVEEPELPALAAHYTFDENAGSVASDEVGAFADAVFNGEASFAAGVTGSAVDLPGDPSQSYVSLPANILDGCDDITIALWMKLGSITSWSRLLDLDGGVDGFLYFTPAQDVAGTPHLYFDIFHPPGTGAPDQGVSAAYPEGVNLVDEWHHVAFTLSAGVGHLYFDGSEIGSGAMTTKPSDLTLGENAHAWIGRSMFPDPYLDATIYDLRVSCAAYTPEQEGRLAQ
jgi:hypothetical protein